MTTVWHNGITTAPERKAEKKNTTRPSQNTDIPPALARAVDGVPPPSPPRSIPVTVPTPRFARRPASVARAEAVAAALTEGLENEDTAVATPKGGGRF